MILPASAERANIVQVSAVRRHRSRNVGHGHGFCIFTASSSPSLWQLPSGKASWLAPPRPRHRSVLPYPSASFAPVRPAPERITPRSCRLIVTAWGRHRFSASSPAVVHLRFAPDHFFRLRLRSPMPEERGHGERGADEVPYRNPSPRPPPAILCGRGSRPQACDSVLPHSSASSSPARPAPVRITPFYCLSSVTAKGSSHRARSVGHGSCRGGLRLLSSASPPAHPIILRYVRVVRCASTARFAARPSG